MNTINIEFRSYTKLSTLVPHIRKKLSLKPSDKIEYISIEKSQSSKSQLWVYNNYFAAFRNKGKFTSKDFNAGIIPLPKGIIPNMRFGLLTPKKTIETQYPAFDEPFSTSILVKVSSQDTPVKIALNAISSPNKWTGEIVKSDEPFKKKITPFTNVGNYKKYIFGRNEVLYNYYKSLDRVSVKANKWPYSFSFYDKETLKEYFNKPKAKLSAVIDHMINDQFSFRWVKTVNGQVGVLSRYGTFKSLYNFNTGYKINRSSILSRPSILLEGLVDEFELDGDVPLVYSEEDSALAKWMFAKKVIPFGKDEISILNYSFDRFSQAAPFHFIDRLSQKTSKAPLQIFQGEPSDSVLGLCYSGLASFGVPVTIFMKSVSDLKGYLSTFLHEKMHGLMGLNHHHKHPFYKDLESCMIEECPYRHPSDIRSSLSYGHVFGVDYDVEVTNLPVFDHALASMIYTPVNPYPNAKKVIFNFYHEDRNKMVAGAVGSHETSYDTDKFEYTINQYAPFLGAIHAPAGEVELNFSHKKPLKDELVVSSKVPLVGKKYINGVVCNNDPGAFSRFNKESRFALSYLTRNVSRTVGSKYDDVLSGSGEFKGLSGHDTIIITSERKKDSEIRLGATWKTQVQWEDLKDKNETTIFFENTDKENIAFYRQKSDLIIIEDKGTVLKASYLKQYYKDTKPRLFNRLILKNYFNKIKKNNVTLVHKNNHLRKITDESNISDLPDCYREFSEKTLHITLGRTVKAEELRKLISLKVKQSPEFKDQLFEADTIIFPENIFAVNQDSSYSSRYCYTPYASLNNDRGLTFELNGKFNSQKDIDHHINSTKLFGHSSNNDLHHFKIATKLRSFVFRQSKLKQVIEVPACISSKNSKLYPIKLIIHPNLSELKQVSYFEKQSKVKYICFKQYPRHRIVISDENIKDWKWRESPTSYKTIYLSNGKRTLIIDNGSVLTENSGLDIQFEKEGVLKRYFFSKKNLNKKRQIAETHKVTGYYYSNNGKNIKINDDVWSNHHNTTLSQGGRAIRLDELLKFKFYNNAQSTDYYLKIRETDGGAFLSKDKKTPFDLKSQSKYQIDQWGSADFWVCPGDRSSRNTVTVDLFKKEGNSHCYSMTVSVPTL